jgi:hypothetical protein
MSLEQNQQGRENQSRIELDAIRAEVSPIAQCFAALKNRPELRNKEPDSIEDASEVLFEKYFGPPGLSPTILRAQPTPLRP